MKSHEILQLGLILAEFMRGLGMQAENMQRQQLGQPIVYGDEEFLSCANEIQLYAEQLR